MRLSLRVATSSSARSVPNEKREEEQVRGLMRKPASFSSGCATSAMPGSGGVCTTATRLRCGLRLSAGARAASTMSCSAAGGRR
jgi:hypothetical protein